MAEKRNTAQISKEELKKLDDCVCLAQDAAKKYAADNQPGLLKKGFSAVSGINVSGAQSTSADLQAQVIYEKGQAECYDHNNVIPPKTPQGLEAVAAKFGGGEYGFKLTR